jgi:polar amino acid transport system substrate-binding protein
VSDVLNAIRSGQADLGIAAISLTNQREQEFDFSHPILVANLQIMVLVPAAQKCRSLENPNI